MIAKLDANSRFDAAAFKISISFAEMSRGKTCYSA
jgi:hypothetical protein